MVVYILVVWGPPHYLLRYLSSSHDLSAYCWLPGQTLSHLRCPVPLNQRGILRGRPISSVAFRNLAGSSLRLGDVEWITRPREQDNGGLRRLKED